MFSCSNFNNNISSWDVCNVTNMCGMFHVSYFNGDISSWNVSNVTNMQNMFLNCPIIEEHKPGYIKQELINKEINSECHISFSKIEKGEKYVECVQCNKCFGYDNISKWLKINNSCPYCRKTWSRLDKVFINT